MTTATDNGTSTETRGVMIERIRPGAFDLERVGEPPQPPTAARQATLAAVWERYAKILARLADGDTTADAELLDESLRLGLKDRDVQEHLAILRRVRLAEQTAASLKAAERAEQKAAKAWGEYRAESERIRLERNRCCDEMHDEMITLAHKAHAARDAANTATRLRNQYARIFAA